jgi:hypothetical protein
LIDSNQDWKSKWFYVTNHHPELPKPSGKQPKHRPWWNTEPTMQEGIQLPEIDDDDIIDRLGRIFKDMPAYTPCPVPEYSTVLSPNEVSSRTQCRVLIM